MTSPRNRRGMSVANYKEDSDDGEDMRDDPDESAPSSDDDMSTE